MLPPCFLIQEDSGRTRKQEAVNCQLRVFYFGCRQSGPMLCLADVAKQGITRKTSQNHVSGSWWGAASSQWLLEKKNIFWLSICWCWSSYVYDVAIAIALLWLLDSWLYIVHHIDCTLYTLIVHCTLSHRVTIEFNNWIELHLWSVTRPRINKSCRNESTTCVLHLETWAGWSDQWSVIEGIWNLSKPVNLANLCVNLVFAFIAVFRQDAQIPCCPSRCWGSIRNADHREADGRKLTEIEQGCGWL